MCSMNKASWERPWCSKAPNLVHEVPPGSLCPAMAANGFYGLLLRHCGRAQPQFGGSGAICTGR